MMLNNVKNYQFIAGVSGYPLRLWLMTRFRDPVPESPEENFNNTFCRARFVIERVNGIYKMRFRCTLKQRVLHYTPPVAAKFINTCAVLHNMAITDCQDDPAVVERLWNDNNDSGLVNLEPYDDDLHEPLGRVNPELAVGWRLQRRISNIGSLECIYFHKLIPIHY